MDDEIGKGGSIVLLKPFVLNVYASLPYGEISDDVFEDGQFKNTSGTLEGGLSNLRSTAGEFTLSVMDWGTKGIGILFIIGVLLMILALIFKNGQWQKYAQTTMLFSFISMLMVRGTAIVILSFRNGMDIDDALSGGLIALVQISIFLGVTGILISFLLKLAYKLIEHPEYHRWSKNVLNVSILMILFSLVGPYLFSIM